MVVMWFGVVETDVDSKGKSSEKSRLLILNTHKMPLAPETGKIAKVGVHSYIDRRGQEAPGRVTHIDIHGSDRHGNILV